MKAKLPQPLVSSLQETVASLLRYTMDFKDADYTLNVTFERKKDNTQILAFNFHYDLVGAPHDQIVKCINLFTDDYKSALDLNQSFVMH